MGEFGNGSPLLLPIFVILAALALVACNNDGVSAAPRQHLVTEQVPAPDFVTKLYQGQEDLGAEQLEFSQLLSQEKPVVLYLWSSNLKVSPSRSNAQERPQPSQVSRWL